MEKTAAILTAVLLALCLGSSSAGRLSTRIRNSHPTDFLVSSLPGQETPSEPTQEEASREQQEEVESMTQQLMERLASRGTDPQQSSVRYILDLFDKLEKGADIQEASGHQGRDDAIADADVIRGLAPTVSKNKNRRKADVTLNFPLSGISGDDTTELAELRIRPLSRHPADVRSQRPGTAPTPRSGIQRVRVSIVDKDGDRQVERVYRVRWRLDQEDDFDVLDVTRILRDMASSGARNFQNGSLEISLRRTHRHRAGRKSDRRAHRQPRSVNDEDGAKDAMMVVYSKSAPAKLVDDEVRSLQQSAIGKAGNDQTGSAEKHERVRRGAGGKKNKRKNRCSSKDMFVDFEKLGWADDIVFPVRYNAKTCSGKCPSPVDHSLHPTNHAILQSMMRLHERKTPRPCCVPVTLKPLMMLYKLADGNIEIRHHPDMIVDQCGCR